MHLHITKIFALTISAQLAHSVHAGLKRLIKLANLEMFTCQAAWRRGVVMMKYYHGLHYMYAAHSAR